MLLHDIGRISTATGHREGKYPEVEVLLMTYIPHEHGVLRFDCLPSRRYIPAMVRVSYRE